MAQYDYLGYQYRSPWHVDESHEPYSRLDLTPSTGPLELSTSSERADELMDRYLQETIPPFFHPNCPQPMDSYPETLLQSTRYVDTDGSLHSYRYPSPTHSGHSSLVSSDTCDSEPALWPQSTSASYNIDFTNGHAYYGGVCVALHDVQTYADVQPEKIAFHEDEPLMYGAMVQEGYHPMTVLPCHKVETPTHDSPDRIAAEPQSDADDLPISRRRRALRNHSVLSVQCPSARVSKLLASSKRPSLSSPKSSRDTRCPSRAFPCPFAQYGCQSTFGSKNEWKRHTSTQHMRFGFWRCDQCPDMERKPNDFNRKDLFVQHVRRMHLEQSPTTDETKMKSRRSSASSTRSTRGGKSDDEHLNRIASSCYRRLRSPPQQSGCPFCPNVFISWDERMEHVGRHLEASRKQDDAIRGVKDEDSDDDADDLGTGKCDKDTENWLLGEKLIERVGKKLVLADGRRKG
nr:hypothetical protein CFP56_10108 [Quercus suber]